MRRKKDVDIANVSFLDMLAGALGAVMILFIIIPKVSFADLERIQTLDSLVVNKANLDTLLNRLQSVVPEEDYQELIMTSANLQVSIESLNAEVENMQSALDIKNKQYANISSKYDRAMATIRSLENQLKSAPSVEQYNKIVKELKEAKSRLTTPPKPVVKEPAAAVAAAPEGAVQPDNPPSEGDAVFGIDPPLTIMINWDDKDDKVHLYMREAGTKSWVFYQTKRRRASFGTWDNSLKKLTSKPYEAILQKDELVPGTFELYAQPAKSQAGKVEVSGFIAMKLPDKPLKRFNITPKEIAISKPPYSSSANADILLGTLTVTDDDIFWAPNQ